MGHFGDSENDCIVKEITQADTLPCAMYPLFIKYDRGYYKPACNLTQNMVYVIRNQIVNGRFSVQ